MIDYLRAPVVHNAFYKKYAAKKFLKGMSLLSDTTTINSANIPAASLHARAWSKKYDGDLSEVNGVRSP